MNRKQNVNNSRYISQGYKNRKEYLASLADDWGIDLPTVYMIADMLGESEDFDGLVNELEDFAYLNSYLDIE